jgi:hydroxyethylthiazole kinase-like uncharacterized protein yjeF
MRSLDRRAIEEFGIEAKLLMENAGHAAYYALREEFEIRGKRFLIFCGTGNNGGDGCVLARKIHADGGFVKVFILGDPGKFRGAAKLNHEIVTRLPVEIQRITTAQDLPAEIARCHMMVDAIFGTGLSRYVGGIYRDVIEIINQSKKVRSQNAHDYVGLEIANACCFMNLAHQKHFLNDWPPIFSPTSSIIRTGASREIQIIQFFHSPPLL